MCNTSSVSQRWKWTINDTLLHIGTFLCLANHTDQGTPRLVLRTCKGRDQNQKWNCAGNFVMQPDSSQCVAAKQNTLPGLSKKSSTVDKLAMEIEEVFDELVEEAGVSNDAKDGAIAKESSVDGNHNVAFETCNRASLYQEWSVLGYEGKESNILDDSVASICSASSTRSHNLPRCYELDMEALSSVTYENSRWATCTHTGYYISGFYHTYNRNSNNLEDSGLISGIECCAGNHVFTGRESTPVEDLEEVCFETQWWSFGDYLITKGWFTCPRGMFLKGLLLNSRRFYPEENVIERARCCKSRSSPVEYMHCYQARASSMANTGIHLCHLEGFQMIGIFRKNCNVNERGGCEEEITCCMEA